jgi:hypothetical protein
VADYARLRLNAEASESSDYATLLVNSLLDDYNLRPDEAFRSRVEVGVTSQTFTISTFDAISAIVVQNTSTSENLDVSWTYTRTVLSPAAGTITFANANPDTIADSANGFLGAGNEFLAGSNVRVAGATDSANNTRFLIQAVAAGLLTLASAETLTARAADAGTITLACDIKCSQVVPPNGGLLVICGATSAATTYPRIYPADNLTFNNITQGGAAIADVIVIGT